MPTRDRRCQCAKHARAETQQRAHGGAVADIARDRLEPARDTAIERVVVDTLPVRLMRLALDRGVARSLEHAVTPPPVTSTIGHIGVERHVRPARCKHCPRSEEHTSELQSLMRISYAVFCLKKNKRTQKKHAEYN